ncbi:class I SAM-dependent methyltransferase [Lentisalinibacter salinarum]|uniref:class I SAM-dependent methyltransferase n=1 Tax=Lentisalinibacter salinarum TaxID=2992239 RepID=UPI00386454E0
MSEYDTKDYWDKKAKQFEDDPVRAACASSNVQNHCIDRVQRKALETVVRRIGGRDEFQGKSLLDFGCGSGRWVHYFAELGASYQGVDISGEMIQICRQSHPSLNFSTMDGLRIPASSKSFDFIFSIAVLHHNRRNEQGLLLSELTRVIKPGGFLFLFEGLGSTPREREFPRTLRDWSESVVSMGYERLMSKRYHYFPLGHLAEAVGKRISATYTNHWRIIQVDAALSPVLSRIVPNDSQGRGAMLFRRIT